jgi:hypothetical protein
MTPPKELLEIVLAGGLVIVSAPTYERGEYLLREIADALREAGDDAMFVRSHLAVRSQSGGTARLAMLDRHVRGLSIAGAWAPHGAASYELYELIACRMLPTNGKWL